MKKFLLLSVLLCVSILGALAQSFNYMDENGVTWGCEMSSYYDSNTQQYIGGMCINSVSETGEDVVFPEKVNDGNGNEYTVTIVSVSFTNNKLVKKVTLPKTCVALTGGFWGCSNLERVENTAQLKLLSSFAFYNCSSLTEMDLSSVTYIPCRIFSGCSKLKTVRLSDACERIEDYAFQECSSLQTINLSNHVKSVGTSAFNGCSNLQAVDLSNCQSVGSNAFWGCSSLNSVGNTANMESVAEYAFVDCKALKSIDLSKCKVVGSQAFDGCSSLSKIDLSACKVVGTRAFWGASSLKEVTGLSNLTSLPEYAFAGCQSLVNIDLSHCDSIGVGAFKNCTSLTSINVPIVKSIGDGSFTDCKKLGYVSFPATLKHLGNCFDGYQIVTLTGTVPPAFDGMVKTVLFKVPEECLNTYRTAEGWKENAAQIFSIGDTFDYTDIETKAEENTSGLQKAIGKDNLAKVVTLKLKGTINGYDVMVMRNKMDNLHYLDLSDVDVVGNSYEYYTGCSMADSTIGRNAFRELNKLVTVKLPKTVKEIGAAAFYNCRNLQSVVLPDSLVQINGDSQGAFAECDALTEVNMPKCKYIGSYTFYNCCSLKEIFLPKGVEMIDYRAFSGDLMYHFPRGFSGLERVVLSDGLKTIGEGAFENDFHLRSIEFPPSLERIENRAFENCSALDSINLPMVKYIADDAFSGCSSLTKVRVPSSLLSIGKQAFDGCSDIRNVYTYTVEPISINQTTFNCYDKATLYVPTQSYDNYYWNTEWSQFKDIQEFDEKYKYFYLNKDYVLDDKRFDGTPDVDINPGGSLTVKGDKDQEADDINIKGDGDTGGSIIGDGNIDAKTITININVTANRWYFFSFPFDILRDHIKCPGHWLFRYYDGAERANHGGGGWKDLAGGEQWLHRGKGYIFQASVGGTLTLKIEKAQFGKLEANDIKNLLETFASGNEQDASWNFTGNPHTSYYDMDDMHYDAPLTYWNGSSYEAVRPGDDEFALKPFQAFFVQKPNDTDGIEFDADKRLTKSESENRQKARKAMRLARGINVNRLFVNLDLSDGQHTDKTRIVFNGSKSQAYERECDAPKFATSAAVPQLYTVEAQGVKYAINERPSGSVQLGFVASKKGDYTLSAARMDQPMLLKDRQTGITFDLADGDYHFSTDAGTFDDRFLLLPDKDATGIAGLVAQTGINLMPTEDGILLTDLQGHTVDIYSVGGTLLARRTADGMVSLPKGVYIVKAGNLSAKVMVK